MKLLEVKAFAIFRQRRRKLLAVMGTHQAFCVCLGTRKRTRPHVALIRCRFNLLIQKSDLFIMIHGLINWGSRYVKNNPIFNLKEAQTPKHGNSVAVTKENLTPMIMSIRLT